MKVARGAVLSNWGKSPAPTSKWQLWFTPKFITLKCSEPSNQKTSVKGNKGNVFLRKIFFQQKVFTLQ